MSRLVSVLALLLAHSHSPCTPGTFFTTTVLYVYAWHLKRHLPLPLPHPSAHKRWQTKWLEQSGSCPVCRDKLEPDVPERCDHCGQFHKDEECDNESDASGELSSDGPRPRRSAAAAAPALDNPNFHALYAAGDSDSEDVPPGLVSSGGSESTQSADEQAPGLVASGSDSEAPGLASCNSSNEPPGPVASSELSADAVSCDSSDGPPGLVRSEQSAESDPAANAKAGSNKTAEQPREPR